MNIVLALSLLVAGCRSTPTPPDVSDWPLVREDDFDDPHSGFAEKSYAHGRWFYQDGRYGIEVTRENWAMWTAQGNYSDFVMEVDVTSQQEVGRAGVIFRVGGGGYQFYNWRISTDGQYILEKSVGQEAEQSDWETILPWQKSPHIRTGLATNRLRVICVGSEIWLYVNGYYLDTVRDKSFTTGGMGMIAENFAGGRHILFHFDNLRVYAPR